MPKRHLLNNAGIFRSWQLGKQLTTHLPLTILSLLPLLTLLHVLSTRRLVPVFFCVVRCVLGDLFACPRNYPISHLSYTQFIILRFFQIEYPFDNCFGFWFFRFHRGCDFVLRLPTICRVLRLFLRRSFLG